MVSPQPSPLLTAPAHPEWITALNTRHIQSESLLSTPDTSRVNHCSQYQTHPEWITALNSRLASLSPSVLAPWSSLQVQHPPRSVTLECARSLCKPFVFSTCISSLVTAPSLVALPLPRKNPQRRQWHPLQCSCLENPMDGGAWWAAVHGVSKSQRRLNDFTLTFHFLALEKEVETHSRVLAWRIPGMAEPAGLPSLGSQRVGHEWSDSAAAAGTTLAFEPLPWTNSCFSGFEKLLNGDIKIFQNIILNTSFTAPQTTLPIVFFRSEHRTPFSPGLLPRPSLLSFRPHLPLRQARTVPSGLQH